MRDTDVLRAIVERSGRDERFAIALVLSAEGSTPRKAGTRAIISADGAVAGTIGGGLVEAEAQRRAVEAIAAGRAVIFELAFDGPSAGECDPICGGAMRILIDPIPARHRDAYAAALAYQHQRRRCELTTTITGEDVVVDANAGDGRVRLLPNRGSAGASPSHQIIEPLIPDARLLVAGGGHVGQALAAHASLAGFEVIVIDDRPEFTASHLYPPTVRALCGPIPETLTNVGIDPGTFIAIVSRGHRTDADALAAVIHTPAAYVGMMGSRRKVGLVRRQLVESGLCTQEAFDRIHSPIGLDIGAQTVPEIAVSIVAELIAVRRGRP